MGLLFPFIKVVILRVIDLFDYRTRFTFLFLDITKEVFAI